MGGRSAARAVPTVEEARSRLELRRRATDDTSRPEAVRRRHRAGGRTARENIEHENKRKQDEYDTKVKEAQKKVKELNDRFADWYYVIPNDVYKKIHLSRNEIIKKPEPDEIKGDGDEFQKLKDAGIDAAPAEDAEPAAPAETPAAEPPAAAPAAAPAPAAPTP